jgi:hypothetical protein
MVPTCLTAVKVLMTMKNTAESAHCQTRQLIKVLAEGDAQPGFDIPGEETAEVEIGHKILGLVDNIGKNIHGRGTRASHKLNVSRLQQIENLARQLIQLHTAEPVKTPTEKNDDEFDELAWKRTTFSHATM